MSCETILAKICIFFLKVPMGTIKLGSMFMLYSWVGGVVVLRSQVVKFKLSQFQEFKCQGISSDFQTSRGVFFFFSPLILDRNQCFRIIFLCQQKDFSRSYPFSKDAASLSMILALFRVSVQCFSSCRAAVIALAPSGTLKPMPPNQKSTYALPLSQAATQAITLE